MISSLFFEASKKNIFCNFVYIYKKANNYYQKHKEAREKYQKLTQEEKDKRWKKKTQERYNNNFTE